MPTVESWQLLRSLSHVGERGLDITDQRFLRRGLGRFTPAHMPAPAHRWHRPEHITGLRESRFLALDQFTHGVRVANPRQPAPVLGLARFL